MRIAVGKALGWSRFGMHSGISSGKQLLGSVSTLHGTPPRDRDKPEDDQAFEPVPDWPNDLNACRDMEATIDPSKWGYYTGIIRRIIQRDCCTNAHFIPGCERAQHIADIWFYGATSKQRCESFLKMHGLWIEEKGNQ